MGKFRQISTELLPLIYVEFCFRAPSGALFDQFSSNFAWELIFE